jgi:hypothetical protein
MPIVSLPYATDVSFKDGQIVLTIQLDSYLANESVEISGSATQSNGAYATFYDIQSVDENPAGKVVMFVKATPTIAFQSGEPVTVSLRASRVWVTVLTESPDEPMPSAAHPPQGPTAGTTPLGPWNRVTAVAWAAPLPTPSSSASETPAGGASFPSSYPGTPPANH